MKASTFQNLIVGLLCLAVAGLSSGLYNQYQRVAELQSTNTQHLHTLDILQRDSNALKDAQEKLQYALKDLKQMVDMVVFLPCAVMLGITVAITATTFKKYL